MFGVLVVAQYVGSATVNQPVTPAIYEIGGFGSQDLANAAAAAFNAMSESGNNGHWRLKAQSFQIS